MRVRRSRRSPEGRREAACSSGGRVAAKRLIPLAVEARANFSRIVEAAATTHERFEVTRAILSDGDLVADVRAGLADLAAGRASSSDELREAMRAVGRSA